jgi:CheY-like chemotaxis protein
MRPVQPVPAVLVVDDTPSIRELLIHTLAGLVPLAQGRSLHFARDTRSMHTAPFRLMLRDARFSP